MIWRFTVMGLKYIQIEYGIIQTEHELKFINIRMRFKPPALLYCCVSVAIILLYFEMFIYLF